MTPGARQRLRAPASSQSRSRDPCRDRRVPASGGAAIPGQGFNAVVLLRRPWRADAGALAAWLHERYGALIPIATLLGADGGPAFLTVDGALVPITVIDAPYSADPAPHGLRPVRGWDPEAALGLHRAHLIVSCGGEREGPDWMCAYATVVTIVAGALVRLAPAMAVVYPSSGAILPPQEAFAAARVAVRGVSPMEAWVTVAPVRPDTPGLEGHHGAVTTGLAPLAEREIEIAPLELPPEQAVARATGAAWRVLDGGGDPAAAIGPADDVVRPVVRQVEAWLRPGVPATVIVDPSSPVDPETLALRPRVVRPITETAAALLADGGQAAGEALSAWADTVPARLSRLPAGALALWRGTLYPHLRAAAAALPGMAASGGRVLAGS